MWPSDPESSGAAEGPPPGQQPADEHPEVAKRREAKQLAKTLQDCKDSAADVLRHWDAFRQKHYPQRQPGDALALFDEALRELNCSDLLGAFCEAGRKSANSGSEI